MCEGCEAKWPTPPGKRWKFIGTCPCRGNDADCVRDDTLWELVDDAQSAGEP